MLRNSPWWTYTALGTEAHRHEEREDVKFYSDAEFPSYTISRVCTFIKSSQYCGLRSIIYLAEDLSSKSIGKCHLVKPRGGNNVAVSHFLQCNLSPSHARCRCRQSSKFKFKFKFKVQILYCLLYKTNVHRGCCNKVSLSHTHTRKLNYTPGTTQHITMCLPVHRSFQSGAPINQVAWV